MAKSASISATNQPSKLKNGEFFRSLLKLVETGEPFFFDEHAIVTPGNGTRIVTAMRLPIIGRIGQKIVTARVAETFSLLLKSGIQLIPAMRVVAGAVGNSIVSEKLGKAADEVEEGKSLQDSLMERDFLPPIVVDMLAVGDEAGSLDTVLDRVHESYSEEVDMFLDNLNRVIEPILIVFLGGAVLIIALAVFLPYWQVDETLTFQ